MIESKNRYESLTRYLPEKIRIRGKNYLLEMGKTGDSSGSLSRFYIGYVARDGKKAEVSGVSCWYEEPTLLMALEKSVDFIKAYEKYVDLYPNELETK